MSNYYKKISIGSIEIHAGCINQKGDTLLLALNGSSVVEVKDNNAYINSKRILTTNDLQPYIYNSKVSFASGIYLGSGEKYLRYGGNCDSGYDTNLRVANLYNTPFPITIKKISIQKGFVGNTIINIPSINYSKSVEGNFLVEDIDVNVAAGEKIYVEIIGEPSLETIVDLYIVKSTNTLTAKTVEINTVKLPTFNEVFINQNGITTTPFSINIT
tara:strand:- start:680 stop:1324 length:645 start_codon:yes stop_codon:yes gene_type:complete